MPFIPLLSGSGGKAADLWRLLGAGLAGTALLCLALLSSRGATFESAMGLAPFSRSAIPACALAGAKPQAAGPLSLVLAATHHKTGTVQLMCLGNVIKHAVGARLSAQVGGVTASDVAAAAVAGSLAGAAPAAAAAHRRASKAQPPAVLLTTLPLSQECYGRRSRQYGAKTFRCPNSEVPCNATRAPSLSLDGCFLSLPLADVGVWHYVRRPLDIVVSALWFHQQEPAPEAWIDKAAWTRVSFMLGAGVPEEALAGLGLGQQHLVVPYGQLLRTLPERTAVQLEFWRSAPGLYAMARQYQALRRHPAALQLRYEDVQRDFNGTLALACRLFFPQFVGPILEAAQQCNPATWTSTQLSSSNHVTAGKHVAGGRERLQGVLLAQPAIKRHLCLLTDALGYEEPRCGAVERRRLRL